MGDATLQAASVAAIDPAMKMLPANMDTVMGRVMLLAIGLQESRLIHRAQIIDGGGKGPARGLWQFERGGGVRGVIEHPASRKVAQRVCDMRAVQASPQAVWERLETDDILAAAFARLLLWTDPLAMPKPEDVEGAWRLYALRTWRPGKPHRQTWDAYYAQARKFMGV